MFALPLCSSLAQRPSPSVALTSNADAILGMPKGTPTALHRPEMPAMEIMEINAEATTDKDGAKTENMAINAEATTAKDGAKTEANRKKKERQ